MALSRIGVFADHAALFSRSSCAANLHLKKSDQSKLHASVVRQYPEAPHIPLPSNVSEIFNIETSRFAPERARDISAPIFLFNAKIGISHDYEPSFISSSNNNSVKMRQMDSHVDSYDCFGAVSLSGAMQTNVPKPFCSNGGKSTFLNMPGGQWTRDDKYIAEDMRKSHFNVYKMRCLKRYGGLDGIFNALTIRGYATTAGGSASATTTHQTDKKSDSGEQKQQQQQQQTQRERITQAQWMAMSKRERLQIIIKDYGKTVIVFHIGISLLSLGIFYGLVSSGLDLTPVITMFSSAGEDGEISEKSDKLVKSIMNQGSTFLIAYAIHKLFAPLRISITLFSTPVLVKYLRRKGILKVPKVAAAVPATKTR